MDDQTQLEQTRPQSNAPVNPKPNRKYLRWSLFALLMIVLLAGTAFGVYQYGKSQSDDKEAKLNSQIADLQSQVDKLNNIAETQDEKTEEDTQNYMVIKQWSVKVPLSQDVDGLTYSLDKNGVASFRTSSLNAVSATCTSNSVNVARGTASQVVVNETGSSTGDTFKKVYDSTVIDPAQLTTRSIKNSIADYYYIVPGYSGASCAGDQQSQATETKATIAIVKAINAMVVN